MSSGAKEGIEVRDIIMHCRKCGKEILDESNFCNFCGTSLKVQKEDHIKNPIKNREFIAPWLISILYSIIISILSLGRVSMRYQDFLASIGLRTKVIDTTSVVFPALTPKSAIPLYEPNYIGLIAYLTVGFIIYYIIDKAMANNSKL